jgi:hydrogenase maturation protein HypF
MMPPGKMRAHLGLPGRSEVVLIMNSADEPSSATERRAFVVTGVVQGVGFRPFVHRLAHELGLAGFVLNRAGEVHVEAEGAESELDCFESALVRRAPPLAAVAGVRSERIALSGQAGFSILRSDRGVDPKPFVSPDVGTCERCLAELFDPSDRRFHYPFLNCTDCGPRFTIIEGAPYDRERTTMRDFALCRACQAEYEDPSNRRFHAEPNACPECGPQLALLDGTGRQIDTRDPLRSAVEALQLEQIVAIKGIGGFHLACLAASERATAELRRRKGRDEKPFALLVRGVAEAAELCHLERAECALLESPERPIVLARRRANARVSSAVAGAAPLLGVMLAYTPLHHLLCEAIGNAPLVLTSGNSSQEPIAFEEADARMRLAPLADRTLTHDRPIHLRCDDSVVRWSNGTQSTLRRARGLAPRPTPLGQRLRRPLLALGGQDNATFALGRADQAFVSHHLGDLANPRALEAYCDAITHYERLFAVEPELLVHDLHPNYASTQFACELGRQRGLPLVAVQHHHAHVVSCMVEHGLDGPVLGVAWDGTGYGEDGTIWGGEFLLCDRQGARRVAHFRVLPMPGAERAVREPWRVALAHLRDAGLGPEVLSSRVDSKAGRVVDRMLERDFNCPRTSSVGRLFDAVSALCGVRLESSYEGQAAIELEWAATRATATDDLRAYPYQVEGTNRGEPLVIDTRPLIRALVAELQSGTQGVSVARRFHATLAAIIAELCGVLSAAHGLERVVLAGGVFANALLLKDTEERLAEANFRVFRPHLYPAGDGGLSLGQLAIAAARDHGVS